jgi:hypothetical protein
MPEREFDEFARPPEEMDEDEGLFQAGAGAAAAREVAAAAAKDAAEVAEAPGVVLEAKAAIEEQLDRRVGEHVAALAVDSHSGVGNIQGVAVGVGDEISSLAAGAAPGVSTLTVFVAEAVSTDEVRSALMDLGVGGAGDKLPVQVVVTGIIEAQPHRFRERPAPGGISVGHVNVTAGTLGCLSVGRQAPRKDRVLMLSNNHVLADVNAGRAGDCITQPGQADGGSCPNDQVAVLERFVPIDFSAANYVDCATGWCWPDRVRRELVYLSGGRPAYFRIGNTPTAPVVGMEVGKSGRTTQLTKGRITAVGASVNVDMGGGRIAQFRDAMSIQASSGDFSLGGDSGSVIWNWASGARPVGLLFAGGSGTTFANRMDRVLAALDIQLWT